MGNLYCALQPKGGDQIFLVQLTGALQNNLEPRFELMDEQFYLGIDEYIGFDGGYNPDENQMLQLQLTDEMQRLAAQMDAGAIGRERYDPNAIVPDEIRALFWCYQTGGYTRILVQNFTRAQAVSRRGVLLSWSNNETFERLEAPSILIGERIDGVIWQGRFEFRSFHVAKQIFDLRDVYREATAQEVEEFLQIRSVTTEDEDLSEKLNVTQRKLIFAINRSGVLDRMGVREITRRAENAGFPLNVVDEQIVLSHGRELTKTLRFLDNGVYRSPIDDQVYISNSHRVAR